MVFISKQVYLDLDFIFMAMLQWNKSELSIEFVEKYIDDIVDECYKLENLTHHFDTTFKSHIPFGSKVHRYRRNNKTIWYVIYNLGEEGNIFVNKIISNYITVE